MTILGIDPGTTRIGYGIINGEKKPALLTCGLLAVKAKEPRERVLETARHFAALLKRYEPDIFAIEKLFFMNNQKTALGVAEIRGILLFLVYSAGIPVFEYAPTEVKGAVAGFGNADKSAVARMVMLSLGIKKIPGPDDVSDALAVALTAFYHAHGPGRKIMQNKL